MTAIHHCPILHVDFAINRFFRPTIIFIFLLFGLSGFSNKANAVEVVDGESQTQAIKPINSIFKVDIFDRTEKLVGTGESVENKVYLDTKGLQSGTYFLHIYSGDQVLREQIIIEN